MISKSSLLLKAANTLEVPVVISEQYRKAFGTTVEELLLPSPSPPFIYEKKQFSMVTEDVKVRLSELKATQVSSEKGRAATKLALLKAHK